VSFIIREHTCTSADLSPPGEVEKLKQQLRENITRAQAGVRLDLNLEKGRIRDELSARDLKLKEVDTRIESEVSKL
jgi:hypothetical protein